MAWSLFLKSAYGEYPEHRRPTESTFCASPGPNVQKASPFAASVEVRYDLADFTRQYLSAKPNGDPVLLAKAVLERWGGIPDDSNRYQAPKIPAGTGIREESSEEAR